MTGNFGSATFYIVQGECPRKHVDDAFLKALVRLTHPDRHPPERRAEATRITAMVNRLLQGG